MTFLPRLPPMPLLTPHTHKRPLWDEMLQGYLCDACPGGVIPCACGMTAAAYTSVVDADGIYQCQECYDKSPTTLRSFPAADVAPIMDILTPTTPEICKEEYYGIECSCPRQHKRDRRW